MSKEWISPAFENDDDVLFVNSSKSSTAATTRRKRPAHKSIQGNSSATGS